MRELRVNALTILAIFVVSLCAASFPALSKRLSFLRIPRIVFFIGKHFGTGVILSTAFTHLLQDAFEALRDPIVLAQWKIGKHTGLIVLGSLLSIFLIEYTSTAYVDRLQSYSSPTVTPGSTPYSPGDEQTSPRSQTPVKHINNVQNHDSECQPLLNARVDPHRFDSNHEHEHASVTITHPETSTDYAQQDETTRTDPRTPSYPQHHSHQHCHSGALYYGPTSDSPHATHRHGDTLPNSSIYTHTAQRVPHFDDATRDVIIEGHHRHEPRTAHSAHHERGPRLPCFYGPEEFGQGMALDVAEPHDHEVAHVNHHHHGGDAHELRIGKKRQVVGILVLQFGIMIHSLVIGLTLAIKTGSDFASLLIAVIFHQLFEGLSLGIRIASLPSSSPPPSTAAPISPASTPGESSPSSDAPLDTECEVDGRSMSLTFRDVDVELGFTAHPGSTRDGERDFIDILKPTLACSFAITTPVGIGLGMIVFGAGGDSAHMRLIQGLMSAISAGMLIYAACVEMLAADFVMDPTLWRSGWRRQCVALGSLFMGAIGMGVVP
ncbi:Zinc/iron permease [Pisolithus marmoratus]|nr:Zinc/iron permease [Pisolithus marmoratus]